MVVLGLGFMLYPVFQIMSQRGGLYAFPFFYFFVTITLVTVHYMSIVLRVDDSEGAEMPRVADLEMMHDAPSGQL